MIRPRLCAALALALFGLQVPASAQAPEPEIVVSGRRLEEAAQQFAAAIALPSAAEDQYARWSVRLCPSVAGLRREDAQGLIDRIARRALEVGIEAEQPGCAPNMVIVFATDPGAVAQEIYRTRRDLLGHYSESEVITAGREALEAWVNTPRPVRWWHVSGTVTADGRVLSDTRTRVGRGTRDAAAAARGEPGAVSIGNGFEGAEAVRSQGSRFRRSTRQDIAFVLVIVDAGAVANLPPSAVADYLAMAALVQLDPAADMTAFPSILNLFAGGDRPPQEMTAWDRAYLAGLYGATREAATSRQQRNEIARRIVENVSH